ncbi:MAG TPA: cytochrome c oxidase subunit I [Thermoleophilia bacterium]|nr:cytochrome c oxidase subunit I [Thermoleophilia bacterium]
MSVDVTRADMQSGGSPRHNAAGWTSWLTTTDHKRIGILYITTSLAFFVVAIGLALLMRTQLAVANNDFLSPQTYNQVFTMHGTTMIFLVVMPLLSGFANYLIPLQIGARDMAYPRLNALSYWVYVAAALTLYTSFIFSTAVDTGWFSYAPLTLPAYSPHEGIDFWILFIMLAGISSILGALNVAATTIKLRAPGMGLWRTPLFTITNFINSFLILAAMPSLTVAVSLLYLDRQLGTSFYNAALGGDPLVWQQLFWFFGHPEVYILILPAFGMISEVTPVFSRKPLFGRTALIIASGLIGFYGFTVWAHHMFAVGLPFWFNALMAGTSFTIAVPTGIKIFNWLATMWRGSLVFTTSLHFVLGFISLFVVGGLTGVTLATVPFDWQVTDTYYVVAHFHNVLLPGSLFGIMAGIYYWYPKVTGRLLDERLGKTQFWLFYFGFIATFFPLYIVGLLGMPRRVYTWDSGQSWDVYNLISTIGGFVIGVGVLIFAYNVLASLRKGAVAGNDPWDAWTLEWATTSPPAHENFETLPPIHSARPLWDLKHPENPDGVPPENWRDAYTVRELEASFDEVQPAPEAPYGSSIPILVAVGLLAVVAGLLLTVEVVVLAVVFVLGALVAWVFQSAPVPALAPPILEGKRQLEEKSRYRGRFDTGTLGVMLFIFSEIIFFTSLIYAYVDLRLAQMTWPPEGLPDLEVGLPAVATLFLIASGVAAHYALISLEHERRQRFQWVLAVAILLGATFLGIQGYEYLAAEFGISDGVYGGTFFTLTGFHGAHVTAGLLAFLFIWARTMKRGGSFPTKHAARGATYYWHFVDAVWLVIFSLIYLW